MDRSIERAYMVGIFKKIGILGLRLNGQIFQSGADWEAHVTFFPGSEVARAGTRSKDSDFLKLGLLLIREIEQAKIACFQSTWTSAGHRRTWMPFGRATSIPTKLEFEPEHIQMFWSLWVVLYDCRPPIRWASDPPDETEPPVV